MLNLLVSCNDNCIAHTTTSPLLNYVMSATVKQNAGEIVGRHKTRRNISVKPRRAWLLTTRQNQFTVLHSKTCHTIKKFQVCRSLSPLNATIIIYRPNCCRRGASASRSTASACQLSRQNQRQISGLTNVIHSHASDGTAVHKARLQSVFRNICNAQLKVSQIKNTSFYSYNQTAFSRILCCWPVQSLLMCK